MFTANYSVFTLMLTVLLLTVYCSITACLLLNVFIDADRYVGDKLTGNAHLVANYIPQVRTLQK